MDASLVMEKSNKRLKEAIACVEATVAQYGWSDKWEAASLWQSFNYETKNLVYNWYLTCDHSDKRDILLFLSIPIRKREGLS
jgi:hypothetical protein